MPRTKSRLVLQNPPADFDEVKRRFIRQNRELAKNNSSQSLRIRSLDLEVSRLLADNLELRNQVLRLQNELHTAQTQTQTQTQTSNAAAKRKLKEELQAKLAELSGIVHGIGVENDVQAQPEESERTGEKKPLEGNWRERQPLTELMRDAQMPTITEDKLYPRRTLGADEVQAIRLSDHSSNESPDLGPPPVAHFDYEVVDPVKNASPLGNKMTSPLQQVPTAADEDNDVLLPANLSVNLETRRKRNRDGQSRLEIRRHSVILPTTSSPPQKMAEGGGETSSSSSILRTGAKRKLADREPEKEKPIKPPSKGDFTFSRKTSAEEAKGKPTTHASAGEIQAPVVLSPKPTTRRVLGDKSVNMSPRKAVSSKAAAETPEKKDDALEKPPPLASKPTPGGGGKETTVGRRQRRISSLPVPSPPREVATIIEIPAPPIEEEVPPAGSHPQPKTPAALDLFSPTASEPSTLQQQPPDGTRGDTPPPSDLSTLSITTDGGGTRPSRRARSAVNYAEPSLMAKMRRPDKKMVDALSGLQRRAGEVGLVRVKSEPAEEDEDGEAWKSLPLVDASQLRATATASPLFQRKASIENPNLDDVPAEQPTSKYDDQPSISMNDKPSASSATISALIAGSRHNNDRKRRQSQSQQPEPLGTDISTDIEAATQQLEDLDIYEFKDSSSPGVENHSVSDGERERRKPGRRPKTASVATATARAHRRHSSVPKDIVSRPVEVSLVAAGDLGLGVVDGDGGGSGGGGGGAGMVGRSERAASRRRSMML